jgi:hypothetical protein
MEVNWRSNEKMQNGKCKMKNSNTFTFCILHFKF